MEVADGQPTGLGAGNRSVPFRTLVTFQGAIMDRLNAAVIATDLEGRLLYANPYAERVYGWDSAAMAGSKVGELAGVRIDAATAATIGAELAAGRTWEGEFQVMRPDGSSLAVHASDSGLYDEDGDLVGVVSVVTDVTDHRESVDRLSRETRALRFLLDATTVLSSSMDFRECLKRLAALAVPTLGDLCLIDILVDETIVRMAASHADPSRSPLVQELTDRYPPDPHGAHPAVRTIYTGRSEISAEMSDEFLRATTRDARHYEIVKELGFTSYMCAPLAARGRTLGTLTLISAESGRRFEDADLALAEDLAHRAALVVDNARLFSERTRVARSLQSALLPPTLPDIPGLKLAARYRAAGEGNDVGGDFYDLFSIGRGAFVAAVGDVCGTGPEAAAVTGLVRHSLHASAQVHRDPASILQTANAVLCEQQARNSVRFCSACCAIIRPGRFVRVTIASAGHPPAFVLRANGTLDELPCQGMVLGIEPTVALQTRRCVLAPGDRMILYTDGLIEARDADREFFGEGELQNTLAACEGLGADQLAGRLLEEVERFTGGRLSDDLALLVIEARAAAS
jgi:PAS domain S-box-containing protein